MNFKINANIKIYDEVELTILDKSISPENATMPVESGSVESYIDGKFFHTIIDGKMSIGRLIFTLDDILKTAILAKNVTEQNS